MCGSGVSVMEVADLVEVSMVNFFVVVAEERR